MYKKRHISTNLQDYLFENNSYSNNIKFTTSGDKEYEIKELEEKLGIIHKYFPFIDAKGYYDNNKGVNISLEGNNDIIIKGEFNAEPFVVNININSNEYDIDIHPFDTLGGLDGDKFEKDIESIYEEENTVSIVISNEGYAVKSVNIKKSELDNWKVNLVEGTQIEGKMLGKTKHGKGKYKEK